MNRITLNACAGILACWLTGAVCAQENADPPFGGPEDVAFAESLWESLGMFQLVGPNAVNVWPFEGSHPHGAIQQVTDSRITVEGRAGRVIVKRNHGGDGASVASVYENPQENLEAVTVMFKREAGYDPENLDWFWVKYTASGAIDTNPQGAMLAGRIGKGGSGGCIACHTARGGADLETLTAR